MADEANTQTQETNQTENPTADTTNQENTQEMDVNAIEEGIRKDEARLSILQEEYNNVADKIADEFEIQLEKNPSSLFNDDELGKFEEQLKGRRGEFEILTESNKFSQENPDVDMEALAEFIQEDLSPRKKKEFRDTAKTKYEFLKLAHEEYKKLNPDNSEEDDNLPPDLSGVNGATGDNSYSSDEERQKYLKSIGIGR
jgi:hypothetical protein